jgi:hypothetical protein
MVDQENLHGRRPVIVRHAFGFEHVPHKTWVNLPQTYMCSSNGSHRPGKAPSITVEHRERPQVDTVAVQPCLNDFSQRVQIGSTIGIHHAFRIASGA